MRAALMAGATVLAVSIAAAEDSTPTTPECITASESGQELRRTGKLRDARARFATCVAASCPAPIQEDCAQRLEETKKATPSIVFEISDSEGNTVPGVTITVDGQPFAGVGTAVDLDPGEHRFTFAAPGLRRVEKVIAVAQGEKRREVVIMDRDAPSHAAGAPSSTSALPQAAEASTGMRPPPTLALVAFGVGGAGLVLGVTAGLVAGGKHSSLEDVCDNRAGTCPPKYADDLDSFETWRTISTVGYVVGLLGAAGGAALWLTAPSPRNETSIAVWLGATSAGIAGGF